MAGGHSLQRTQQMGLFAWRHACTACMARQAAAGRCAFTVGHNI
jgi:hypothetical protein